MAGVEQYRDSEVDPVLRSVCSQWIQKIRQAERHKLQVFGVHAAECADFYNGPRSWDQAMLGGSAGGGTGVVGTDSEGGFPALDFKVSVNKTFEFVTIFGPSMYYENPVRTVKPRLPAPIPWDFFPDPQTWQAMMTQEDLRVRIDGLRSVLLENYLNWTPAEFRLYADSRLAIDEALIKGRGCLAGGTLVYVRTADREGPMRVRDLQKLKGKVELWDGERWNRVIGVKQTPRVGDELKITLRSGEEIDCTRDHIWPTGRGLRHADQLEVGDTLPRVILPEPAGAREPAFLPDDIGWFVGLYMGDGCISSEHGRRGRIHIAGHVDEVATRDRVRALVASYGGTVRLHNPPGTKKADLHIESSILVAILREFTTEDGAYKKHFSAACWRRSNAFVRALLDGYLAADGHYVEKEEIWRLGFCRNKALAEDLRLICARLGLRLTLKTYTGKNLGKSYTYYKGAIRTRASKAWGGYQRDLQQVVAIGPADWRCDYFYDISLECSPHTYALASGTLTHNCLWTELYRPPGSPIRVVRSRWQSVDDLLIDPDADGLADATWIARRRCMPCWQVERDHELRRRSLRGNLESQETQALAWNNPEMQYDRKRALTNDLIVFYQVWSKMGLGGRLWNQQPNIRAATECFGDYCYIEVADSVPFPLNCPPDASSDPSFAGDPQAVFARFAWPTPFWYDDAWPVTCLDFHSQHRCPWPLPHLKAAMGELKFLNWVMSFLMGHLRTTSRVFLAVKKSLGEDIKNEILQGRDLTLLQLEAQHGAITELVQFLNHPQVNGDIWTMIREVESNFDKRVGLTELMYGEGGATQVRSAAEINLRNQNMNVRPADMANQVEAWMSEVAQSEALAARYHLRGDDVRPVLGMPGAYCWDAYVATTDLAEAARQLEYQIEAGSTRRPNKEFEAQTMSSMAQLLMPLLQQYAMQTGDVGPLNNLLQDLARSRSLDPGRYLLRGMPAPPPAGGPGGVPPGEGEGEGQPPVPEESGEAAPAPGEHRNGRPAGALA